MGDRTHVTLTVLREQTQKTEELIRTWAETHNFTGLQYWESREYQSLADYPRDYLEFESDRKFYEFVTYGFDDVNYGSLPFTFLLIEAGIAYEESWSQGDSYCAGENTVRFTEHGEVLKNVIEESDELIDFSDIHRVFTDKELISDPSKAFSEIQRIYQEALKRQPISWENQVEYGKRYAAKQLLTGKAK